MSNVEVNATLRYRVNLDLSQMEYDGFVMALTTWSHRQRFINAESECIEIVEEIRDKLVEAQR